MLSRRLSSTISQRPALLGGGGAGQRRQAATATARQLFVFPRASGLGQAQVWGGAGEGASEAHTGSSSSSSSGTKQLTVLNRYRTLVLDSTYQPVHVVNWQRAICLEISTKVDVLEYYEDVTIKAPRDEYLVPAVVRVRYFNKHGVKKARVALNRHNIFLRDGFQCAYCGSKQNLTLDHILPSSLGGGNSWENLVTCCSRCNSLKGSKTLKELKWKLRTVPREPSPHECHMMLAQLAMERKDIPQAWTSYLQPLTTKPRKQQASSAQL